ncbi:hypothetical protein SLS58_001539 [Diplodia intermedia]|uniref:Uncharacterized protein n=1 Tax=Diplodia intermedia TaxID=856260 RepID=A0ABR3U1J2_9PEZI
MARLVMRSRMVRVPHPEPSTELREKYWKSVTDNREAYAEAVHLENELLVSVPLCISQIRSQLRTPAGATREEAEVRRARLVELAEKFEAELEEMRRGDGRLRMQEVHCGERYGYLKLVIGGVRKTYFIE